MTTSTIDQDLHSIRFEGAVIDELLKASVTDLDDIRLSARYAADGAFRLKAVQLTQEILLSTTLAQTIKHGEDFTAMLPKAPLGRADKDLHVIGMNMLSRIAAAERIADPELPDAVVASRFEAIKALL